MHTPERARLTVLDDVIITVDDGGTITAMDAAADRAPGGNVDHELGPDIVLLPGLIDTHLHAPQWQQLGTGLDLPLEDWLFQHTFPLEQRLTDPAVAAEVWPHMVSTLLAHGSTAVAYYATVSVETTTMLAATCAELGQRAFVGRVGMDHPEGTPGLVSGCRRCCRYRRIAPVDRRNPCDWLAARRADRYPALHAGVYR